MNRPGQKPHIYNRLVSPRIFLNITKTIPGYTCYDPLCKFTSTKKFDIIQHLLHSHHLLPKQVRHTIIPFKGEVETRRKRSNTSSILPSPPHKRICSDNQTAHATIAPLPHATSNTRKADVASISHEEKVEYAHRRAAIDRAAVDRRQ